MLSFFFIWASLQRQNARIFASLVPSFRPRVVGNTGKLPCPDRPRDILPLCISKLIHFPKLLYNLCDNLTTWEGRGTGGRTLCAYWSLEWLDRFELEWLWEIWGKFWKASCPKPASWPSILENSLSLIRGVSVPFPDCSCRRNCPCREWWVLFSPHVHRQVCGHSSGTPVQVGWDGLTGQF